MTTTINLREANQGFSQCIRAVEAGEDFVITRNGAAVAKLVPIGGRRLPTPAQVAALERLTAWVDEGSQRMVQNDRIEAEPFDRDTLHER